MIYQWKTIKFPVPAQVAGEEIERISAVKPLTAESIVEESKPAKSPLHTIFEWNNIKAGHEWRKQQARVMLGNLVTVSIEETPIEQTRAYVNISNGEETYTSIETVIQDKDLSEKLLSQALKELTAFRGKYKTLERLRKLFREIDVIVQSNAESA